MVGMIIAGADPLEAVRLQIVVLYMLLGSVSIAAILVGTLSLHPKTPDPERRVGRVAGRAASMEGRLASVGVGVAGSFR